nr:class I SAM-dependent methyltransferase [Candidatus Dadabacteria bacterium]
MNDITINSASFRDPKGKIIHFDNRILRLVAEEGAKDYEFVRDSGLYEQLIKDGFLIDYTELNKKEFNDEIFKNASYILEHPEIDFISYPYEWSFAMLQAAAVLQLDLYLKAINKGVTLSDATAYNIQFLG